MMTEDEQDAPVEEVPTESAADTFTGDPPIVRRSVFMPQEMEIALARAAEADGTTVNELIVDVLGVYLERQQGTS
ncbi:MAG TPA: hypothetical protein VF221_00430 [Chloroflexota bacterium]